MQSIVTENQVKMFKLKNVQHCDFIKKNRLIFIKAAVEEEKANIIPTILFDFLRTH